MLERHGRRVGRGRRGQEAVQIAARDRVADDRPGVVLDTNSKRRIVGELASFDGGRRGWAAERPHLDPTLRVPNLGVGDIEVVATGRRLEIDPESGQAGDYRLLYMKGGASDESDSGQTAPRSVDRDAPD